MPTRRTFALPTVLLALALATTGCGGDDATDTTTAGGGDHRLADHRRRVGRRPATATSTTAQAATDGRLTVDASEFDFAPTTATAEAGKLTITMKNVRKVPHELVLLKTTTKADGLKVTDGRVSEDDSVGEISETDGGVSKDHTFTLKAGTYVYVCNIPGHYMDGMRGTLTVR